MTSEVKLSSSKFPRNYIRYLQTTLLSNSHIVSTERN